MGKRSCHRRIDREPPAASAAPPRDIDLSGPPERDRLILSGPPARISRHPSPSPLRRSPKRLRGDRSGRAGGLLPLGDQGLRDRDRTPRLADRPGAFPGNLVRRSLRPDVRLTCVVRDPTAGGRRLVGPGESRGACSASSPRPRFPAVLRATTWSASSSRGRRRTSSRSRRDRRGSRPGANTVAALMTRVPPRSRGSSWPRRPGADARRAGGVGDLMPTCTGPQSRNRQVGSGSAAGSRPGGDDRDGGRWPKAPGLPRRGTPGRPIRRRNAHQRDAVQQHPATKASIPARRSRSSTMRDLRASRASLIIPAEVENMARKPSLAMAVVRVCAACRPLGDEAESPRPASLERSPPTRGRPMRI